MKTTFGKAKFVKGMHFMYFNIEYVVSFYGLIPNDSPFDPFVGCYGVITTSGDEFDIPAYFNDEIDILQNDD